jgi:hypothetical protein
MICDVLQPRLYAGSFLLHKVILVKLVFVNNYTIKMENYFF